MKTKTVRLWIITLALTFHLSSCRAYLAGDIVIENQLNEPILISYKPLQIGDLRPSDSVYWLADSFFYPENFRTPYDSINQQTDAYNQSRPFFYDTNWLNYRNKKHTETTLIKAATSDSIILQLVPGKKVIVGQKGVKGPFINNAELLIAGLKITTADSTVITTRQLFCYSNEGNKMNKPGDNRHILIDSSALSRIKTVPPCLDSNHRTHDLVLDEIVEKLSCLDASCDTVMMEIQRGSSSYTFWYYYRNGKLYRYALLLKRESRVFEWNVGE